MRISRCGRRSPDRRKFSPLEALCRATDDALGEALGQKYVEITFGADGKQRMLKMVDALEKSLDEDIQGLPWMTR